MKKVIRGNELYNKLEEAICLLCDTVKSTLGPKGSNVIIDHSTFSPFITNDGVTIANNIESEDEAINTILELTKEAAIKTNEKAGDGTTTTLVLLESIFKKGLELIKKGRNPIIVKKELDLELNNIIKLLEKEKVKPNLEKLKKIAMISANDQEIGNIVFEAFKSVKSKEAIILKEIDDCSTKINYLNGYIIETNTSPYFFKENIIDYINPLVLVVNKDLFDLEELSIYINEIYVNKRPLVIIANDFNDTLVNEVISLNLENDLNICLLKAPYYGIKQFIVLKDLAFLCNANICQSDFTIDSLGTIDRIKIDKNNCCFFFKKSDITTDYGNKIAKECQNDIDLDFNNKRIAFFKNGIAEINIGGNSKTERREKLMRFEDSVWAINCAVHGVLPGSGLTLLKIANKCKNDIFKDALQEPFKQIMNNSGLDVNVIEEEIINNNFQKLFNVNTNNYENVKSTLVLDPYEVVINSLINATSIAGMLLTTTSLVINEYSNNIKNNDFNEL